MPIKLFYRVAPLIAAAAAASCGGASDSGGQRPPPGGTALLPAVEAVQVMFGSLPLEERMSGSVRALNQTEIYADVSGTIEQVLVDDGDQVAAGDPLVRLRARDFEERVRQAEAGVRVAEARVRQTEANQARVSANLERIRRIFEQQLGTLAELDAAEADAISAEADLDLMRAQLSQAESLLEERRSELADTVVKAPIDGIVGARNAEIGQQAGTGAPLFVIGDVDQMQVDITLTQAMLGYIDVGTPVAIYSDIAPDRIIEASISTVSPYLHEVTRTTRAEIHLADAGQRLRPGMFVTVDVLYGESGEAPLVPNSAIFRHPRDGREGMYVTDLSEALSDPEAPAASPDVKLGEPVGPVSVRFVPVDVVARGRDSSGVAGVREGDWVVTLGHNLLANADQQQAVVQPTPWEHILELQGMESRDLLDVIREKQPSDAAASPSY